MEYPDYLYYSREHLWVKIAGNRATIGITDYAQQEMGEILFVDLSEEGTQIEKDEPFGTLESSKTVVELLSPITGELVALNKDLEEEPSLVNDDPYGSGWLVSLDVDDPKEVEEMMSSADYEDFLEKKGKEKEE